MVPNCLSNVIYQSPAPPNIVDIESFLCKMVENDSLVQSPICVASTQVDDAQDIGVNVQPSLKRSRDLSFMSTEESSRINPPLNYVKGAEW
jgi:hypothetical protein